MRPMSTYVAPTRLRAKRQPPAAKPMRARVSGTYKATMQLAIPRSPATPSAETPSLRTGDGP